MASFSPKMWILILMLMPMLIQLLLMVAMDSNDVRGCGTLAEARARAQVPPQIQPADDHALLHVHESLRVSYMMQLVELDEVGCSLRTYVRACLDPEVQRKSLAVFPSLVAIFVDLDLDLHLHLHLYPLPHAEIIFLSAT